MDQEHVHHGHVRVNRIHHGTENRKKGGVHHGKHNSQGEQNEAQKLPEKDIQTPEEIDEDSNEGDEAENTLKERQEVYVNTIQKAEHHTCNINDLKDKNGTEYEENEKKIASSTYRAQNVSNKWRTLNVPHFKTRQGRNQEPDSTYRTKEEKVRKITRSEYRTHFDMQGRIREPDSKNRTEDDQKFRVRPSDNKAQDEFHKWRQVNLSHFNDRQGKNLPNAQTYINTSVDQSDYESQVLSRSPPSDYRTEDRSRKPRKLGVPYFENMHAFAHKAFHDESTKSQPKYAQDEYFQVIYETRRKPDLPDSLHFMQSDIHDEDMNLYVYSPAHEAYNRGKPMNSQNRHRGRNEQDSRSRYEYREEIKPDPQYNHHHDKLHTFRHVQDEDFQVNPESSRKTTSEHHVDIHHNPQRDIQDTDDSFYDCPPTHEIYNRGRSVLKSRHGPTDTQYLEPIYNAFKSFQNEQLPQYILYSKSAPEFTTDHTTRKQIKRHPPQCENLCVHCTLKQRIKQCLPHKKNKQKCIHKDLKRPRISRYEQYFEANENYLCKKRDCDIISKEITNLKVNQQMQYLKDLRNYMPKKQTQDMKQIKPCTALSNASSKRKVRKFRVSHYSSYLKTQQRKQENRVKNKEILQMQQDLTQKNLMIRNLEEKYIILESQLAEKRLANHKTMWFPKPVEKTVSKNTIDLAIEEIEESKNKDIASLDMIRERIKSLTQAYQNNDEKEDENITDELKQKVKDIFQKIWTKEMALIQLDVDAKESKSKQKLLSKEKSYNMLVNEVCHMTTKSLEYKSNFCHFFEEITDFRENYLDTVQKIQEQDCIISKIKAEQMKYRADGNAKLERAKDDLKKQKHMNSESRKCIADVKYKVSQICKAKKKLQEELLVLCRQLRALSITPSSQSIDCENCRRLEDEIGNLHAEYDKLQNDKADAVEEYDEFTNEMNSIRSNLAKKITRFKKNLRNRKFYLKSYMHELTINMKEAHSVAIKSLSKREGKINVLQDQLDCLYSSFSTAQEVLERLKD